MKSIIANDKLNSLISLVEKKGIDSAKIITELKSMNIKQSVCTYYNNRNNKVPARAGEKCV